MTDLFYNRSDDPDEDPELPQDLERCPRCGELIADLIWGKTNCPRCGLHFECC
jgi:ribosomal protein S27AE